MIKQAPQNGYYADNVNLGSINIFQVNDPKNLIHKSEKGPDTATGTEPFPSMEL